ncbi:hypothetical protein EDD18DRAFT_1110548 [Armillaria luteobubalina]|uniref:Aconitase/3-isopropylmalate dehydratase large subunit alpha/beta/alpha domain-containing protein n=1 Tax=Armillaria luteobubalina TaxID=153913 RepID=A0AA39PQ65_9AGAR|nr:hypothetical protein EDD18DRAFT_1110548 [Armillaria luteobubalina]
MQTFYHMKRKVKTNTFQLAETNRAHKRAAHSRNHRVLSARTCEPLPGALKSLTRFEQRLMQRGAFAGPVNRPIFLCSFTNDITLESNIFGGELTVPLSRELYAWINGGWDAGGTRPRVFCLSLNLHTLTTHLDAASPESNATRWSPEIPPATISKYESILDWIGRHTRRTAMKKQRALRNVSDRNDIDGDPFILPEMLESLNGQVHYSEVALQGEGQCGTPELARVTDTENDDNIVVSFSRSTFSIPPIDWRLIDSSVSLSLALTETEYTSACTVSELILKVQMRFSEQSGIYIFVPKPAFYVRQSIGRQPFFEGEKTKQKLLGKRGKAVLDVALRRFGVDVWWLGARMLTISVGWHSSRNLSKIKHYIIRGFDVAGNMAFTAELADRMVDSEAWVYRANQSKETFDANDYARIVYVRETRVSRSYSLGTATHKYMVVYGYFLEWSFTQRHQAWVRDRVGDYAMIRPGHVMTHDNTGPVITKFFFSFLPPRSLPQSRFNSIGETRIHNIIQPVFTLDHDVQNRSQKDLANIDFYPSGRGIGHQVLVKEGYAFPHTLAVASDSHSNMYGGVGCVGTPIVQTDAAALGATGKTWRQVPRMVNKGRAYVVASPLVSFNYSEVLDTAIEFTSGTTGRHGVIAQNGPVSDARMPMSPIRSQIASI